ncbi:hypothetical protein SAMN04515674_102217 [Pseudarcicella hirudinis]|uniref:Lipoprotein n=1 Tax=Pseudarcicella hirudinis TaxID=1079859 RepID=A0A1I5P2C5_9BACT|nr:hypothetical protein [Pseudarcicella hirudinis]SFP27656.1 hypothetical protein SAMN04515674_102217 [Pseudarcicella hirudinis]
MKRFTPQFTLSIIVFAFFLVSSCSSRRVIVQNRPQPELASSPPEDYTAYKSAENLSGFTTKEESESVKNVPELLASADFKKIEESARGTKYEAKFAKMRTILADLESKKKVSGMNNKPGAKLNFAQKSIIKNLEKKVSKMAKTNDFSDMDGTLKIGLILLAIAILLAIFGLGLISGIAGLVGIICTIIGLVNTYG